MLPEVAAISDALTKSAATRTVAKLLNETAAITDTVLESLRRLLTDSVAVSDTIQKRTGKLVAESATIADTLTRQPCRLFTEILAIGDSIAFGRLYSLVLSETIAMTDAVMVSWKRLLQFIISGKP